MKSRTALLAALLAASRPTAADTLPASASACFQQAAAQPAAVFDVVVSTYPTVFERGLAIKEINRIRPVRLPPQAIAHGLSMVEFGLRVQTKSEVSVWGTEGRVCAWVASVVVDMTPGPIRIYIPKEYRPGRCESNQLSLHEMVHEGLYRRAVLRAADKMRFALAHAQQIAGPSAPIDAANPEEAYARLKRKVDEVVRPVYGDLIRNSREDQDALDTPETYRRLGESCSHWKKT